MSNDLAQFIEFTAEHTYRQLVSAPKSNDYSLKYYSMQLKTQRASERDFRQFSLYYAEALADKLSKIKKNLTDKEKNELTVQCLDIAMQKYQSEKNGR